MADGRDQVTVIETLLIDGLAAMLTRRMAERIVADVRRNRAGAPLPTELDALLAVVRGDVAQAAFLRIGARAERVVAEVEDRIAGLALVPVEAWGGPRVRLVYVGACPVSASHVARELNASEVVRVDELFELLMALDTDERTLVAIDPDGSKLDPAVIARFVMDFPAHVLTFVASTSPTTREAFLSAGAAFRAMLRSEPMDHPDVPQLMRDLVDGAANGGCRRTRGGTSTTTEPAYAA